jgi:uncharacterized membrane protein
MVIAGMWESLSKQWRDGWSLQLVVWGTVLILLVVVAYFVVRKLRGSAAGNDDTPLELLTNFREMKLQGDISDKEFRTIKALLNEKQAPTIKQNQDNT